MRSKRTKRWWLQATAGAAATALVACGGGAQAPTQAAKAAAAAPAATGASPATNAAATFRSTPGAAAEPGVAAAPGSPPATGTAASITTNQAEAIVWALPETKAWAAYIEKASKGVARATTMILPEDPEVVAGKRYWSVNFYETQPDHIHRWQTFMVRLDGKEILVDTLTGDYESLQEWRTKEHPLERAREAKPK